MTARVKLKDVDEYEDGLYFFNNELAKNPICFYESSHKALMNYSLSGKSSIRKIIEGEDYKGFCNVTQDGKGYAIGTVVETRNYKLPTILDAKMLIGLLVLAKRKNASTLKYNGIYTLLREMGFPATIYYANKLRSAIDVWSVTSLSFDGSINLKLQNKLGDGEYTVNRFHVSSVFIDSLLGSELSITFSPNFLKLVENKQNFSKMYFGIVSRIARPIALTLYQFLISNKLHLQKCGSFCTNFKAFCHGKLGLSKNSPPDKLRISVNKAVDELNEVLGRTFIRVLYVGTDVNFIINDTSSFPKHIKSRFIEHQKKQKMI